MTSGKCRLIPMLTLMLFGMTVGGCSRKPSSVASDELTKIAAREAEAVDPAAKTLSKLAKSITPLASGGLAGPATENISGQCAALLGAPAPMAPFNILITLPAAMEVKMGGGNVGEVAKGVLAIGGI